MHNVAWSPSGFAREHNNIMSTLGGLTDTARGAWWDGRDASCHTLKSLKQLIMFGDAMHTAYIKF